jgi:hypothetical protein
MNGFMYVCVVSVRVYESNALPLYTISWCFSVEIYLPMYICIYMYMRVRVLWVWVCVS